MPKLLNENRKYQRYQHTTGEIKALENAGLTPVVSSNVSAIGREGNDLIIRFHGGATYRYPGNGKLYDNMLKAGSKGKFVWDELIRKNVPYQKAGAVLIKNDIESKDMMAQQKEQPKSSALLTALALGLVVDNKNITTLGIIASLALVQDINKNAKEAENNSRQA